MSQPPPHRRPGEPRYPADPRYQRSAALYAGEQYAAGHYPGQHPTRPRGTNELAIAALICLFLFAPASILLGSLARRQIRRTGEEGWGMATVSLVLGVALTVVGALAVALLVVMSVVLVDQLPTPS